jgi:hypothetical protein
MELDFKKSHIIMLCAVSLLGLTSGPAVAVIHSITNSNFTFLDPGGALVGSADDVFGTFDDSQLCSDVTCMRTGSMTLASNTTFFGYPWTAHDIRVFTEGTYTFDTNCTGTQIAAGITDCGGGAPLTLIVGPGQLGMHGLWDWAASTDIDVAIVWNLFDTFPTTGAQIWNLASTDGNGDGVPGIPMVDGPFPPFNVNYNLNMDPPFDLSGVSVAIDVIGGNTQECTETGGSTVTMEAETTLFGDEMLSSLEWTIDGAHAGVGETISPFLELGSHNVAVLATTISGATSMDSETVNVADTSPPTVDVAFVDRRSGNPISVISRNRIHFVTTNFSAADICDPDPVSEGVVTAFEVENGDTVKIQANKETIQLETATLKLSVTATDASGNARTEKAILSISN